MDDFYLEKDVCNINQSAVNLIMNQIPHICKNPQYACLIQKNVEARRQLNQLVYELCEFEENREIKPQTQISQLMVGHRDLMKCIIIILFETCCYQCIIDTLPKKSNLQFMNNCKDSRIPQHSIKYKYLRNKKVDNDNNLEDFINPAQKYTIIQLNINLVTILKLKQKVQLSIQKQENYKSQKQNHSE